MDFTDFLASLADNGADVRIIGGEADDMPIELLASILEANGLPDDAVSDITDEIKARREAKAKKKEKEDTKNDLCEFIHSIGLHYGYEIEGIRLTNDGIDVESITYAGENNAIFAPEIIMQDEGFFMIPKCIQISVTGAAFYISMLERAKTLCEVLNTLHVQ